MTGPRPAYTQHTRVRYAALNYAQWSIVPVIEGTSVARENVSGSHFNMVSHDECGISPKLAAIPRVRLHELLEYKYFVKLVPYN